MDWPDIVTNTYEGPERREVCEDLDCQDPVRWHNEEGCLIPLCKCRKAGRSFYLSEGAD